MATSETKKIKKQETLVRFSIISYKTRLRVYVLMSFLYFLIISDDYFLSTTLGTYVVKKLHNLIIVKNVRTGARAFWLRDGTIFILRKWASGFF